MTQPDLSDVTPPTVSYSASPRRRRLTGALMVILGVLLFGMLLFRIVGPKPVPPPKVIQYTPQQAEDARKDLDALASQLLAPPPAPIPSSDSEKVASVAAAKTVPPSATVDTPDTPAPVRFQLSQADLNTYLATDPKVKTLLAARGIQAVQLILQEPHNLTCRAAILYKGRKTNVQISGDLRPDRDNVARFIATKAQVGALPLPPRVVTSQANRLAGLFLVRVRGRIPVAVQDIQVLGDHLILTGVRLPAHRK